MMMMMIDSILFYFILFFAWILMGKIGISVLVAFSFFLNTKNLENSYFYMSKYILRSLFKVPRQS
jgi:hypothetical protein